jgi:hypothetical protein
MTDRTQFEAMLEALINEDRETAKEIFHNIVVAKSREIYEELLESEFYDDEEEENESVDDEEDDEEENPFDSEEDDMEDDSEEDDMEDDSEEDPFGDEEGDMEDDDIEDRVMDLEDALDELKAEFEQLMSDEEGMDDEGMDADMGGLDNMNDMNDMAMDTDELETDSEPMMEYTRKVSLPKHGDNGANSRSVVAKPNRMGGTSANIAKNFSTEKGGTEGGLASPKAGDLTSGLGKIHNRKDSTAGKTAFKKSEPGHGAEKKGKGEVGGVDKRSLIGSGRK